jgi:predicted acyltransferase
MAKTDSVKQTERLASLDVMRGFDMLWIIGGGGFVMALAKDTQWGWLQILEEQMHHVKYIGFHFFDLIFPMFMFISGVAIPYAINAKVEAGADRNPLLKKIVKRGIILVLLGILYNGTLEQGFQNMRVASVLGQIGLGYLFAGVINLYTRSFKMRIFWLAVILATVATLHLAVPVPGYGAGIFTPEAGINGWLDRLFLPGRLHRVTFDPQGILSIFSAISVTLMGSLAGSFLRDGQPANGRKTAILAISGSALIITALLLSNFYPVSVQIWTVPLDLLAVGISSIILSLFYFVIDVKKWTNWFTSSLWLFFKVIGMNSITIYLITRIKDFNEISRFFTGWLAPAFGEWIIVIGAIAIEWMLLYYLYKKKIFLRI